jgi:hypothetical protein
MTTVSDSFDRADSTDLGGNWSSSFPAELQIVSNALRYSSGSYSGKIWNANTFTGNQFAQLTLVQRQSNDWSPGPCIRAVNTDANKSGYYITISSSGQFRLYRNSSEIYESGTGQFANGDVMRIEDRGGGSIVVMKNGVDHYTAYTDGTPLTGTYIGIEGYVYSSGGTTFIVDDWSGGDLSGAASIVPQAMAQYINQVIQ